MRQSSSASGCLVFNSTGICAVLNEVWRNCIDCIVLKSRHGPDGRAVSAHAAGWCGARRLAAEVS